MERDDLAAAGQRRRWAATRGGGGHGVGHGAQRDGAAHTFRGHLEPGRDLDLERDPLGQAGRRLPAGATYSPMWFDPVTRSLLAVACCVGPPPSTGGANTTWRWTGAAWTLLTAPDRAPVNGSTMALDPVIDRLVLCACGTPPAPPPALFAWDGSDWAALPAGPPPIGGATAITDFDLHELLVFGTPKSAALPDHSPVEVWALTGSTWSRLGPAG